MGEAFTLDLFAPEQGGPGSLALDVEVKSVIAGALHQAQEQGVARATFAERMSWFAGERIGENALNDWASAAHPQHRISLARAAAFDAVFDTTVGGNPLLGLLAAKRGLRLITSEEAALVELGRIHQQERDLAARKRALEVLLRGKS